MLSFLARRYDNNAKQGKYGQCNQTNHREDDARLNIIANRNLSRPQRVPLGAPYRLERYRFASRTQSCSSRQNVWQVLALPTFTPAKFWIHAAIQPSKQMCGLKAAPLDERPFRAERAQANMKHWNCGTGTKAASAAKA